MKKSVVGFSGVLKEESNVIVKTVKEAILDGEEDIGKIAVFLKKISKVATEIFKDSQTREAIDEEIERYAGKGQAVLFGAKVEHTVTSTSYDFSMCNHAEYDALCDIERLVKAKKKEIEKMLKELTIESKEVVIPKLPNLSYVDSGEVIEVFPPAITKKRGAKFTV
jgi:hypothetical protein